MIILIVKIIIFIVILIMVFNFTLKKYVGNYIDNYSEVMNHIYYSRNPDKDQSGIYKNESDKPLSYEEYKYLVLEDDLPPKKDETDDESKQNENTNNQTEESTILSPAGTSESSSAPAPSDSKDKGHNCDVCSLYTEVDEETNNKICLRKDPTGERYNVYVEKLVESVSTEFMTRQKGIK